MDASSEGRAPRPSPSDREEEVRVRFFGLYRELAGTAERRMSVSEGTTVGELVARLRGPEGIPELPAAPAVAVNLEYASPDRSLRAGDEVALIPPVSGG